jgi:hypothetical protein
MANVHGALPAMVIVAVVLVVLVVAMVVLAVQLWRAIRRP